ncbi:hypothetical protein BDZ91DRAFT_748417 [Kalaharituber pfeilii]|nr:hypothetical protein BDZ91DRAFT_748417 [Kalaharituber pfeilii]
MHSPIAIPQRRNCVCGHSVPANIQRCSICERYVWESAQPIPTEFARGTATAQHAYIPRLSRKNLQLDQKTELAIATPATYPTYSPLLSCKDSKLDRKVSICTSPGNRKKQKERSNWESNPGYRNQNPMCYRYTIQPIIGVTLVAATLEAKAGDQSEVRFTILQSNSAILDKARTGGFIQQDKYPIIPTGPIRLGQRC